VEVIVSRGYSESVIIEIKPLNSSSTTSLKIRVENADIYL
jgi:hypothetical protein